MRFSVRQKLACTAAAAVVSPRSALTTGPTRRVRHDVRTATLEIQTTTMAAAILSRSRSAIGRRLEKPVTVRWTGGYSPPENHLSTASGETGKNPAAAASPMIVISTTGRRQRLTTEF